mgnify:CR=1 FL=1
MRGLGYRDPHAAPPGALEPEPEHEPGLQNALGGYWQEDTREAVGAAAEAAAPPPAAAPSASSASVVAAAWTTAAAAEEEEENGEETEAMAGETGKLGVLPVDCETHFFLSHFQACNGPETVFSETVLSNPVGRAAFLCL